MVHLLKQEASAHGDKLQILSIKRLQELKDEMELFKENEDLNGFQKWIVDNLYKLEEPTGEFVVKSIILIAIPHPSYAKAEFAKQGKKYSFMSLVMSDFDNTESYLNAFLIPQGYHIKSAPDLPLKRLAAKSGLAVYGRNNICYVDGMGSFFSFAAYFSDMPCDHDDWMEIGHAEICGNCNICFNSCPTGAIRKDRFLINNEKCLSYFNEVAGDFPEWIPVSVHHCLYDCLKCQIRCPMNREYAGNVLEAIQFSEAETDMLLAGSPFEEFPSELKQKSKLLGLNKWLDAIPRNLKILFELSEQT